MRSIAIIELCALAFCARAYPLGESTLIPATHPRDSLFDPVRSVLYFGTWNSTQVARYDVINHVFLTPMQIAAPGNFAVGMDITSDGNWLYVATTRGSDSGAYIAKFDLNTGLDHGYSYSTPGFEGGAFDLVMTNRNTALVTPYYTSYLREIDLATDSVSVRQDAPGSFGSRIRDESGLSPSANRDIMLIREGNISSGPAFV